MAFIRMDDVTLSWDFTDKVLTLTSTAKHRDSDGVVVRMIAAKVDGLTVVRERGVFVKGE